MRLKLSWKVLLLGLVCLKMIVLFGLWMVVVLFRVKRVVRGMRKCMVNSDDGVSNEICVLDYVILWLRYCIFN